MKILIWSLFTGGLWIAALARAHDMGDPRDGRSLARQACSECHAVEGGQAVSPHTRAPSFQTVANAPGMNATALRVWFESSHPSMPNLALSEKDGEDVIAYIVSLRKHR